LAGRRLIDDCPRLRGDDNIIDYLVLRLPRPKGLAMTFSYCVLCRRAGDD